MPCRERPGASHQFTSRFHFLLPCCFCHCCQMLLLKTGTMQLDAAPAHVCAIHSLRAQLWPSLSHQMPGPSEFQFFNCQCMACPGRPYSLNSATDQDCHVLGPWRCKTSWSATVSKPQLLGIYWVRGRLRPMPDLASLTNHCRSYHWYEVLWTECLCWTTKVTPS